ncbi:MAG: transposase, partial [Segetibacter sp.]
ISYNSCRNRHCPKCQAVNRERWITAQQKQLLPVPYFHVVFTLPQEMNLYCLAHASSLYNLLFKVSKATIETFATDTKHLGAIAGMVSILHTWGQNLILHPHIHMIVPAGGFTLCGHWKHTKNKGRYLFPVKAMSIVFKNKFMQGLQTLIKEYNLPSLSDDDRKKLYSKSWVVYAKQPFGGPEQVIEYLARYSHKVAISNHRITAIADGKVSFRYKDYADGCKQKTMTLEATEFLRRFCLHILPKGFRKIRHY